jgi:peptidoglycan/xylan/chitin deacetylase (PgdA/CDA1 family)
VEGWKHHLAGMALETAYFTGLARFAERKATGQGIILKFQRVRPRSRHAFQPLKGNEITPSFLRRAIATLRCRNFDIVTIDEACKRIREPAGSRRFAVLTFDGGYSDFKTYAYPVLQSLDVPFAVYIPTGFIDGVALPWWLTLEELIAQTPRLSLLMEDEERRFRSTSVAEKYHVFDALYRWLRELPPVESLAVIKDACARYRVDMRAAVNDALMNWADIATLAADPRATIGSATVNYAPLAKLPDAAALREMKMGRRVLESILGRECRHFACPFGDEATFTSRDERLVGEAGFASAVTARAGLMAADSVMGTFDLPRLAWDGRWSSMRILQVLVSGLAIPGRSRRQGKTITR